VRRGLIPPLLLSCVSGSNLGCLVPLEALSAPTWPPGGVSRFLFSPELVPLIVLSRVLAFPSGTGARVGSFTGPPPQSFFAQQMCPTPPGDAPCHMETIYTYVAGERLIIRLFWFLCDGRRVFFFACTVLLTAAPLQTPPLYSGPVASS